jgi:hypothetical protein
MAHTLQRVRILGTAIALAILIGADVWIGLTLWNATTGGEGHGGVFWSAIRSVLGEHQQAHRCFPSSSGRVAVDTSAAGELVAAERPRRPHRPELRRPPAGLPQPGTTIRPTCGVARARVGPRRPARDSVGKRAASQARARSVADVTSSGRRSADCRRDRPSRTRACRNPSSPGLPSRPCGAHP